MSLTAQELESKLWSAANTLRGSAVGRTDWMAYILPLLFFKRISDVFDEEVVQAEGDTSEPQGVDEGKAALTTLFEESKSSETPIMVQRVVDDIDNIVREVRFDGWQSTHAGEREVKAALRKTMFKYKLHQDTDLFDKAYGYIRQYY